MSIQVTMPSLLKAYIKNLSIAFMTLALVVFAWANIFFHSDLNAYAATAEGIGNQVQGKVEQGFGSARRTTGDLTDNKSGEIKGGFQQVKGEARQNIGTAQNKLDEAKNKVEDKSESLIDSVKNLFD